MSTPQIILDQLERFFNVIEITEGTLLTTEEGHIIEVRAICDNDYYVHPADYPGYALDSVVYVWCWYDPTEDTSWSDWVPADYLRDSLTEGSLRILENNVFILS